MRILRCILPAVALAAALTGCETMKVVRKPYDAPAYRPSNPNNVRVKVSLKNQMVYVMEGSKPLLVTATCVGTPSHPTPKGNFRVTNKIARKRSNTYGIWVNGSDYRPAKSSQRPGGGYRYVGYPMAYWVEFYPAYGFHEGWVHPIPKTHGCLRLHRNVAQKFFALVKVGTPVNIANTQSEDESLGKNHRRPADYNDPEFPFPLLTSQKFFERESPRIFEN